MQLRKRGPALEASLLGAQLQLNYDHHCEFKEYLNLVKIWH